MEMVPDCVFGLVVFEGGVGNTRYQGGCAVESAGFVFVLVVFIVKDVRGKEYLFFLFKETVEVHPRPRSHSSNRHVLGIRVLRLLHGYRVPLPGVFWVLTFQKKLEEAEMGRAYLENKLEEGPLFEDVRGNVAFQVEQNVEEKGASDVVFSQGPQEQVAHLGLNAKNLFQKGE